MPGVECDHDTDSRALMLQLLRAVPNPAKFAEILSGFVNCPGCSTAAVSQFAYELAGIVWDSEQQDDDQSPLCTCEHPVSPEVYALRLVLAADSQDDTVLGMTLSQLAHCPSCMLAALVASTRAQADVLNAASPAWRPVLEHRLLTLLDDIADTPPQTPSQH